MLATFAPVVAGGLDVAVGDASLHRALKLGCTWGSRGAAEMCRCAHFRSPVCKCCRFFVLIWLCQVLVSPFGNPLFVLLLLVGAHEVFSWGLRNLLP